MYVGNVFLLVLNLPMVGVFAKILQLPRWVLMPTVILGLVLGPLMEKSLRRALALSGGEWSILFDSPIAIVLWILAAVSLLSPLLLRKGMWVKGR
jgi:putative tricarboxylic transport membrane protein